MAWFQMEWAGGMDIWDHPVTGYEGPGDIDEWPGDRERDRERRRERVVEERKLRKETEALNKGYEEIEREIMQYKGLVREQERQIDQLTEIALSYKRPAVIKTIFDKKQSETYLPSNIRRGRGSVGVL